MSSQQGGGKPPWGQPGPHGYPQQPQQPYPQQPQQPYPQQPQQPYPPQPQQPYPQQPQQPYPQQPYPQQPQQPSPAPAMTPGSATMYMPAETMVKTSLGRAFRLRIEPNEISPREQRALLKVGIVDPYLQAFLAWRRSVLFLVAVALVPLTGLRFYDAFGDDTPEPLRFMLLVPAGAEALLCVVCWYQLKNWTRWRTQRRALAWTWAIFMIAPFLVFLVPVDVIVESYVRAQIGAAGAADAWAAEGAGAAIDSAAAAPIVQAFKLVVSIFALLTLAPKAVSLLAGSIRAGLVTKMLFPGTSGPGWLVVAGTPLYTLFVFTLLIVPYQLTGSGWYAGAMLGLAAAQITVARAGYRLTKPTTHDDAVAIVKSARAIYLLAIGVFVGCLIAALGSMVEKLGVTSIISVALSFQTNVLILTLIGSDLVIAGLNRARGQTDGAKHLVDDSHAKLAAFADEVKRG